MWARELIDRERRARRRAEAFAEQASLSTSPEESAAVMDRYGDRVLGLGISPQVSFRVAFPHFARDMSFIDVRPIEGEAGIRLHATSEIVVRSSAINAMDIVPWPNR